MQLFAPFLILYIHSIKILKADFLRTRLKSLPWREKVPKAEGVIWNLVSNKCYFWSNLNFDFQLTSNRYDLVLLGKCLGFAPRSESFAIEPSVQVCSISSLSEFRFAQYVRKSAMPNLQKFTPDQNGQ